MNSYWKFVNNKEVPQERVLGRDHYWHYNSENSKDADTYMVKVVMKVGDFHDFHRHPEMNEILYILKGKAEQWIENEMKILVAGDSVYIDPNVIHATINAGNDVLEFLAILGPSKGWDAGTIDMAQEVPYSTYRTKLK